MLWTEQPCWVGRYVVSSDIEEASRCLAELSVPHFHHELVKRALLAAFGDSMHAAGLLTLLAALSKRGQVNQVCVSADTVSHSQRLIAI